MPIARWHAATTMTTGWCMITDGRATETIGADPPCGDRVVILGRCGPVNGIAAPGRANRFLILASWLQIGSVFGHGADCHL